MTHAARLRWPIVAVVAVLVLASGNLASAAGSHPARERMSSHPADLSAITHIVVIMKENRTFDNMFGTYPGADGVTTGTLKTGQVIPLGPGRDSQHDIGHSWNDTLAAMDKGKMNGFAAEHDCTPASDYACYTQFHQSEIPNYWAYAQNFTLADHMFSSQHGPSFENHLFMIAGQAGDGTNNPVYTKTLSNKWGCDAPVPSVVQIRLPQQPFNYVYPCFDFPTLGDELSAAGVSWKYYAAPKTDYGYVWQAYDAIKHIRQAPLQWTAHTATDEQFISDAQKGTLPAVTWMTPPVQQSDHPPYSLCAGENWTVQQINAIMQSAPWPNTIILVSWDDYGGFYDHVSPPQNDFYGLGMRVPLLIISPYAKRGAVVHTTYEFSSFLRLIEERYDLPALTARDANASDLLDAFDFNQTPSQALVLPTRQCPALPAGLSITDDE